MAKADPLQMDAQEIVERLMTHHWDMAACQCWVCENGRTLGFRPRADYLHDKNYPPVRSGV